MDIDYLKEETSCATTLANAAYNDCLDKQSKHNNDLYQQRESKSAKTPKTLCACSKMISKISTELLRSRRSIYKSGYSSFTILFIFLFIQLAYAQRIETQPQTYEVRAGESVQLPCNFADLDNEHTAVIWKRGTDILTIDDDISNGDNHIQIKKEGQNYTLTISPVESYDSATYTCTVTSDPPVGVTHKLQVHVSPTVKLVPALSPLLFRVGEEILVKCVASGNPPPTLSWRKLGNSSTNINNGQLRIANARLQDAGVYECAATNGVGDVSKTTVDVRAEDAGGTSTQSSAERIEKKTESAPWVETDRTYISAKLGESINLTCRYDGDPEPTVDWLFSGFKINNFDSKFKGSAKYASFVKNHSITTFSISEINDDHFGDYTCKISNRLGTVERTIHLSGRPGPPNISILNNNSLSWTVQSTQPVFEYKIQYRLATEDMWTQSKIVPSSKDDQQGEYWTHKIPLDFLNPDTDYEIQVSARNELGWGSLAKNFVKYRSSSANGKISSNALDKSDNSAHSILECSILRLILSGMLGILPLIFAL